MAGSNIGGAGSNGSVHSSNGSGFEQVSLGGVGNPSGNYELYRATIVTYDPTNGTGGLLILYSQTLINKGIISANGTQTGTATISNTYSRIDAGGSSGGGSINIFYNNLENSGTIIANGGAKRCLTTCNGSGGNGTVSYTQI